MEICNELKVLSDKFKDKNHKLYIVGGFVRDSLLGTTSDDIDITSSMPCEEVLEICKELDIKTSTINSHLGTLQIRFNNFKFEYTRFRSESYEVKGAHSPSGIKFVDDINIDTLRRDFTINSIYYDIDNNEYVDISSGREDISKQIIRTTNQPDITLLDDGLRILRAVRFASTLNFKIERTTLSALKKFAPNLNQISKERILKELTQLVVADLKLNKPNTQFLKFCNKLKLPKYMFNATLHNLKKFSKNDITSFYRLSPEARLIGFYILILKNHLNFFANAELLGYTTNVLLGLNGIKESSDNIRLTEKLYRIIQNYNFGFDILNATINFLTLSDTERELVNCFIDKKSKTSLSDNIKIIKDNNLPLGVHQLPVTPEELIELGIEKKFISKILSTLYNQVLNMKAKNTNEDLKKLAKEINETLLAINDQINSQTTKNT